LERRAEQELADAWMATADRAAVTRAADRIELALSRDPLGHGESRSGTTRLLFARPLSVLYRVDAQARVVWVVTTRLEA